MRREANNDVLEAALQEVINSRVPVSTSELIERYEIKKNVAISLRRALNRECVLGTVQRLIRCDDDSWVWISGRVSREECAAHAVNIYLQIENAGVHINPKEFEAWMTGRTTQPKQSAMKEAIR